MEAGDAAERCCSADAMLAEPSGGIASRIEAWDRLAVKVDDFRTSSDPDARIGVVKRGSMPSRIERRRGDLVHRPRLLEICVDTGVDEGIVSFHRLAQGRCGHRPPLVLVDDL